AKQPAPRCTAPGSTAGQSRAPLGGGQYAANMFVHNRLEVHRLGLRVIAPRAAVLGDEEGVAFAQGLVFLDLPLDGRQRLPVGADLGLLSLGAQLLGGLLAPSGLPRLARPCCLEAAPLLGIGRRFESLGGRIVAANRIDEVPSRAL